jgi:hypothetical protein
MADERVAPEVALAEFERMCAARRVDIDESKMSVADKKQFADRRKKAVDAIVAGTLVIADDGTPTFTPENPPKGVTAITFHEATGADFMAADKFEGDISKTVAVAHSMTRLMGGEISRLRMRDFNLCLALANLFLD